MNNDLKIIKKKYGEAMMHLCRELFPTILDNSPGILSEIIQDTFYPTHYLYDDLVASDAILKFKEFIYILYDKLITKEENEVKCQVADPATLMKQTGYTLYECTCEEDIQKFKKYYAKGEELCTFRGGRLEHCFVYFAIYENADKLKRRDFSNPRRQDEYGVSVISIQFTRDPSHTLSIKNRYNHTVVNPDATFSNNLDNIVPGLTQSFADHYGMIQEQKFLTVFELPNYVRANDGKFYKYNYESYGIYYCPDNVVINHYQVTKYPKEKYLIMDYFILDLVNKKFIIFLYHKSFVDSIGQIKNIKILNNYDEKIVIITPEVGEDIIIELDKFNRMISYKNNNVTKIGSNFLSKNCVLRNLTLDNVQEIDDCFLLCNQQLKEINLPNVLVIGDSFICQNTSATKVDLPNVLEIGKDFMFNANVMTEVLLPKLMKIGVCFLYYNESLKHLELPSVVSIEACFLYKNEILETIYLPNVRKIGYNFLRNNEALTTISLPNVETIAENFCHQNEIMESIFLPKVRNIGNWFMNQNQNLKSLELPNVLFIGEDFLRSNTALTKVIMPSVMILDDNTFKNCSNIKIFYVPVVSSKIKNPKLRKLARKDKLRSLFDGYTINKTK